MVILYGQMSQCDRLPREVAVEDIWYALDMLPRFRWRWERKDMNGGHPLIEKLAEKVLGLSLGDMKRSGTPVLIPEDDWEASSPTGTGSLSPAIGSISSPKNNRTPFSGSYMTSGVPGDANGDSKTLAALPAGWFWPMDPENPVEFPAEHAQLAGQQQAPPHGYQPIGTIGCEQSQEAYILEEKDPAVTKSLMQPYMNRVSFKLRIMSSSWLLIIVGRWTLAIGACLTDILRCLALLFKVDTVVFSLDHYSTFSYYFQLFYLWVVNFLLPLLCPMLFVPLVFLRYSHCNIRMLGLMHSNWIC